MDRTGVKLGARADLAAHELVSLGAAVAHHLEEGDVLVLLAELVELGGDDLARPAPRGRVIDHNERIPCAAQRLVELLLRRDLKHDRPRRHRARWLLGRTERQARRGAEAEAGRARGEEERCGANHVPVPYRGFVVRDEL